MEKPLFRNFLKQNFLIDAPRTEAWTRKALDEGCCNNGKDLFIFVFSPPHQWAFSMSPDDKFEPREFCDWLELVTGVSIQERTTWPDLELEKEPRDNWIDLAEEMPCRKGPGLWDILSREELLRYTSGGKLPDDIDKRGRPDSVH